jgi:acetoin utilization protein AcuB
MTPQPLITVTPDTRVTEAQKLMQDHNIRHLPVITNDQKLVGLVNREAMLKAVPWSTTALSTLETQYILSKVTVSRVMLQDVITANEDMAIEEAARIMVDHKVNCLPVLREGSLVGIMTDTDLLSTTMEMLGARRGGLRLSVMAPDRIGEIARLSTAIAEIGGNLAAFGTWVGEADSTNGIPQQIGIVLKVEGISKEQLTAVVEKLENVEMLDIREL